MCNNLYGALQAVEFDTQPVSAVVHSALVRPTVKLVPAAAAMLQSSSNLGDDMKQPAVKE